MASKKSVAVFGEIEISGKGEMLSLTDMWKAAGEPEGRRPANWLRHDAAMQFIEFIAINLNVPQEHIVKTVRGGRQPGTWAHWQVALAYAKTLDHRLHAEVNAVYRAHQEAKTQRQASIQKRNEYTDCLAAHGVEGRGYAICTNGGYLGVYGRDAAGLREKHGLAPTANVRAAMSGIEQAAMFLTEALAVDRIKETAVYGADPCADATFRSGRFVREAIINERNDRKQRIAP